MFLGEYQINFSGKGRVILPKKLRGQLQGNGLVLSRGFEGCVLGFDKSMWDKEAEKQLDVALTEERGRVLRRYFFSASEFVDLDYQGRFVIPGNLLRYAQLSKEIILIGAGDHFEIWDKASWGQHIKKIEEGYARVS